MLRRLPKHRRSIQASLASAHSVFFRLRALRVLASVLQAASKQNNNCKKRRVAHHWTHTSQRDLIRYRIDAVDAALRSLGRCRAGSLSLSDIE